MEPTNQKAYNQALIKFVFMWTFTTAMIVIALLNLFQGPKYKNKKLTQQVKQLRADSIQQHLLISSLNEIDSTIESLLGAYDERTVKKLENLPSQKIASSEMKNQLNDISQKMAEVFREKNEAKEGEAEVSDKCQEEIDRITHMHDLAKQQWQLDMTELRIQLTSQ